VSASSGESGRSGDGAAESATPPRLGFWGRIKEHKVLQWSLAYLGAALALAHAQELLAHNFQWPESVGHVLIGVLIVGFPVVVALAWYHGHRGMTRLSAGELTVVSLLLLVGAGLLIVLVRSPAATQDRSGAPLAPAAAASAAKPRLAILPFENLSPDKANDYFADGLHEEILTALANRAQGLEVISRTTMNSYRGRAVTVQQIAKDLGATRVLEGSVRRDGNQVRLTLQLIDAPTDEHLWAQNYDRTLANTLQLESEVAGEVATQLSVRLNSAPAGTASAPHDPHAYDLYVQALGRRNAILEGKEGADIEAGVFRLAEGFSQAIAADPTLAEAYAERFAPRLGWMLALGANDAAADAAQGDLDAAERLAPADPKVLGARARYLQYALLDWEGADHAYAVAETAGLSDPLWIADKTPVLINLGRRREAIELNQRLLMLDPRNNVLISYLANAQLADGRLRDAAHTLESALQQRPDDIVLQTGWAVLEFEYKGDLDASSHLDAKILALTQFDRLRYLHQYAALERSLSPPPRVILGVSRIWWAGTRFGVQARGWARLLAGDRAGAQRDGEALLALIRQQKERIWNRAILRSITAQAYVLTGKRADAIAAADEALVRARETRDAYELVPELSLQVAAVLAWSGAEDRAADLLASLAATAPGPGPAIMTRDPLFTLPLAHNARYQQLVARLEAQMKATQLR